MINIGGERNTCPPDNNPAVFNTSDSNQEFTQSKNIMNKLQENYFSNKNSEDVQKGGYYNMTSQSKGSSKNVIKENQSQINRGVNSNAPLQNILKKSGIKLTKKTGKKTERSPSKKDKHENDPYITQYYMKPGSPTDAQGARNQNEIMIQKIPCIV